MHSADKRFLRWMWQDNRFTAVPLLVLGLVGAILILLGVLPA